MFESKGGVIFVAGIGFFAFAFLSNVALPILMYQDQPEQTVEEVINPRLMYQFEELSQRYPEPFRAAFGEPTEENCADALRLGRQVYIGEGCWHCHSQFVRPVSNESLRYGPVAQDWEYQNELQRPVMFGTRRVGPRPEPPRGTPRQRLARRAFLSTSRRRARFADAAIPLAVRRRAPTNPTNAASPSSPTCNG